MNSHPPGRHRLAAAVILGPCSISVLSVFYVCSVPKSLCRKVCSMCSMFLLNKGYKEIFIRGIRGIRTHIRPLHIPRTYMSHSHI